MTKEISIKLEAELRLMAMRGYSVEAIQNWCANKLESKGFNKKEDHALHIFANARDELQVYLNHLRGSGSA
jgi:hypothetical protein